MPDEHLMCARLVEPCVKPITKIDAYGFDKQQRLCEHEKKCLSGYLPIYTGVWVWQAANQEFNVMVALKE